MYLGRLVELGPAEALIADPAHPYTAALIAAVPEADPRRTRAKAPVPLRTAEVPSEGGVTPPLRRPPGCPFHPRCPRFEAGLCDAVLPLLTPVPATDGSPERGPGEQAAGEREVACHVAVRERTSAERLAEMR